MPLILSGLVTLILLLLIEATENGGSSFAWLFVLGGMAAHWLLFAPPKRLTDLVAWFDHGRDESAAGKASGAAKLGLFLSVVFVIAAVSVSSIGHFHSIFEAPIYPRGEGQMSLLTQFADRLNIGDFVYDRPYQRGDGETPNYLAPGVPLPFLFIRKLGLDWRFTSLGAIIALGAVALWAVLATWRITMPLSAGRRGLACLAVAAFSTGFLFSPRMVPFLTSVGHTPPIWPLILMFALSVSCGAWLMASIALSVLMSCSVGWILMLPVYIALVWREQRSSAPFMIGAALLLPALVYGSNWREIESMLQGIIGHPFVMGEYSKEGHIATRLPSLAGFLDALSLRPAVYAAGVFAVVEFTARTWNPDSATRGRLGYLAATGFFLILCAPATFSFHYYGQLILIAGLVPGYLAASPSGAPASAPARSFAGWRTLEIVIPLVFLAVALGLPAWQIKKGLDGMVNYVEGPVVRKALIDEDWNFVSGEGTPTEHVWGKTKTMHLRVPLDSRGPAKISMSFGTLSGEWVPPNPVKVRVNGTQRAFFEGMPGQFGGVDMLFKRGDLYIGCNMIELESEWARPMTTFPGGVDSRTLSIFFGGLKYEALTKDPPDRRAS